MTSASRLRFAASFAPTARLLQAVLGGVPDAIFVKDRDRRYVLVNDAFVALAGKPVEEVLGALDAQILDGELAERYARTDAIVLEEGQPVRVEDERYVDGAGVAHYLATTKVPLRNEADEVAYVLGIVHDLTRAKSAEEALRVANEELERRVEERTEALRGAQQALLRKERLAVLGQLAGGLAHQIRNPLAAITNAASVLKRRLGDAADGDVQAALAVIREEVWEANRIITDLLDYARIRPPSLAPVAVGPLIESALALARPQDGLKVEQHIDASLSAWIDERQMRDALGNVIRNAVEAMPDGGKLTIEAAAENEDVLIAVEDTGPGLTRGSLTYLFEPLVTSKPLGLGLGLATAKALIENQSGTIQVSTAADGNGARFEIRVPRAPADG
ncbi:two-component system sensor histidine kinase NtrB [Sandaracinus amylolyticus]|uniref:two-component system sensor histidine kinase NtrB n=1 Tax=Sandaracinus amylolyticus TaxID=927083 RepID=UPI001F483C9B|nr:PAS domain-containing protein [Sandaracinus amylolyticus]UJR78501.1 Periplasmic sensor signal transduction histidine kinase [Sandaracinus amylolyticus]